MTKLGKRMSWMLLFWAGVVIMLLFSNSDYLWVGVSLCAIALFILDVLEDRDKNKWDEIKSKLKEELGAKGEEDATGNINEGIIDKVFG